MLCSVSVWTLCDVYGLWLARLPVPGSLQTRTREWVAISWPTGRTWFHTCFPYGGTSTTWEAFRGPVPARLPQLAAPLPGGGEGEASVGETSWEWGRSHWVAAGLCGGCWLENSGSGSQDVVGTGKTLGCFIPLSAEGSYNRPCGL